MLHELIDRTSGELQSPEVQQWQRSAEVALHAARSLGQMDPTKEQIVAWLQGAEVPNYPTLGTESSKQRCEVFYYAGEACLLKGETSAARRFFQRVVDTGLWYDPDSSQFDPMAEYHLAKWRLGKLDVPAKPVEQAGV